LNSIDENSGTANFVETAALLASTIQQFDLNSLKSINVIDLRYLACRAKQHTTTNIGFSVFFWDKNSRAVSETPRVIFALLHILFDCSVSATLPSRSFRCFPVFSHHKSLNRKDIVTSKFIRLA
jgi:hypothetical protein